MASVKLSVNLSPIIAQTLKDLSIRRGVSMTEVLRQAISHEKFFQDAEECGSDILLETSSGLKQVVFYKCS